MVEGTHNGQVGYSFSFNFDGQLTYEVTRGLKLGVDLRIHTGHDFQEYTGGVLLSYTFQSRVAGPGDRSNPFGGD